MRGYIRIRTPDDAPGHWTARGDLVPGHRYTYVSGDVAVFVDWQPLDPDPLSADDFIAGLYLPADERPSTPMTFAWIVGIGLIGLGVVLWLVVGAR